MRIGQITLSQTTRSELLNSNNWKLHYDNLCKKFRAIRYIIGLTEFEFAEMLGCTKQTISNIERKEKMTKTYYIAIRCVLDTLFKSMDKFKVDTILYLIGEDSENYSTERWMGEWLEYAKYRNQIKNLDLEDLANECR